MPAKRAARISQATAVNRKSNPEDVLTFFSSILTVEQFSQATEALEEKPDGQTLLACDEEGLRGLGLPGPIARKVDKHLKEVRAALTLDIPLDQEQDNDNVEGVVVHNETTPVVEDAQPAPAELALPTAGLSTRPAKRGRPPKATGRQPRLSQRLDDAPVEADDDVVVIDEEKEEENTRRPSRHRTSRLAAIFAAKKRMEEEDPDVVLSQSETESEEEEIELSDVEEEGPTAAARPRGRGRPRRRAVTEEFGEALQSQMEVETVDNRPEEPNDGVHPDTGAEWMAAAREGLEGILKSMTVPELIKICDDKLWPAEKYYKVRARNGVPSRFRGRTAIAAKMTKQVFSDRDERGDRQEVSWGTVDEFLKDYVNEDYVRLYLNNVLYKQFACPPKISDPRQALWRLWSRPVAPGDSCTVVLGQITFPLKYVGQKLQDTWYNRLCSWNRPGEPYLQASQIAAALEVADDDTGAGEGPSAQSAISVKPDPDGPSQTASRGCQLEFVKSEKCDWENLVEHLDNLPRQLVAQCRLDFEAMKLRVQIVADMGSKGELLIKTAYLVRKADNGSRELKQVWLEKILQAMDHLEDSELLDVDLEALNINWDQACDDLEKRGVPLELVPENQVDPKLFDAIMSGVENLDHPGDPSLDAPCEEQLQLRLRPHQKRALSFMLREERSQGGTARHLWLKVPLPEDQSGVECYVSPSLYQLYLSRSPTATAMTLGNTGGSGWCALEMGMGKTAVCIAATLFNPPPADWRRQRPWTPFDKKDYLKTVTENMIRGGTLVVVPTTLVRQWEMEIVKTLECPEELRVLRWMEGSRTNDCKEIAGYDIVITTPQLVTKTSTLRSIYWHRIIVDEAQLNAGSMMQSGTLFSTHRWIVTGTPCNAHPETMLASLDFLRLGGYDTAQRFLPPALATVLRAVMLRYTKEGKIDGETNLELPRLNERVVVCTMNEEDENYELENKKDLYQAFLAHVKAGMKRARLPNTTTIDEVLCDPESLNDVCSQKQKVQSYLKRMKGIVGGGVGVKTGDTEFIERLDKYVPVLHYFTSKAHAVVAEILRVKTEDKEKSAKILIFSEYEEMLKTIARLLPDISMDHRMLLGSTSAKKRGEAIEAFMTDPPTRVFLLAAKAGAVGITLTAATHVYICEPLLNPSLELQAIGRSRRMGQTQPVTVTRMYCRGTIEERIRRMLERRHGSRTVQSTAMQVNQGATEISFKMSHAKELLECELGNPAEDAINDNDQGRMPSDDEDEDMP